MYSDIVEPSLELQKIEALADQKSAVKLKDLDTLLDRPLITSAENLLETGITSTEQWEQCRKLSDAMKDQQKKLDAARKVKVGPFNEIVDLINGWCRPRMTYLKKLETDLGAAYTRYFNEQEEKRKAAERKAAEEKAERERQKAAARAQAEAEAEAARKKAEAEARKLNKDSLFDDQVEVREAEKQPAGFTMQPVVSSNVESLGYDAAGQRMAVQFKTHKRYIFKAVPETVYRAVLEAKSVGVAFNQVIKNQYEIEAIEVVTPTAQVPLPAAPAPVVPPALKPAAPIRKTWKARITNPGLVPREFCVPSNELIMDAHARARVANLNIEIPGVEFYCEETLIRSRG